MSKLAIGDYIRNTLLYHIIDHKILSDLVESTLHDLAAKELIAADSTSTFEATKLGKAIAMSSFAPERWNFYSQETEESCASFRDGWRDGLSLYVHTNSIASVWHQLVNLP